VLTAARRFDDLGMAQSPIPTPAPVEATVRSLRPAQPPLPDDGDEYDEDDDVPATRNGTDG
jgi:DNA recombination protein RmuC